MNKPWISIHIFYASNPDPLIVECIDPLIDHLRRQGMIRRYFFIKYWQEGPHVRLRLLPAEGVEQAEVKHIIEPVIEAYLKHRPALYDVDNEFANAFYKDMFIVEYGADKWEEKYGKVDKMPLRPNNTFAYIDYEPEYLRYGGVEGIEIAEWHFEKSSEIVTWLLRNTNIHVHSILLGLSAQLSLALCYGFLEEDEKVVNFLTAYIKFWQQRFPQNIDIFNPSFDKKFLRMAPNLQRRISEIRSSLIGSSLVSLTAIEREWITHINELRHRIKNLVEAGKFTFVGWDKDSGPIVINDLNNAYNILLSSYIHMTNNRLGATIPDEIYLSYILKRSLEDKMYSVQGVTP